MVPRGAVPNTWRAVAIAAGSALVAALIIQVPPIERLSNWLDDVPARLTTRSADWGGVLVFDIASRDQASEASQLGLVPYKREISHPTNSSFIPELNTISTACGSHHMLNSATGVTLPM